MKPPPFLLGGGLLFWGWQAGYPGTAVLLAAILEGAPRLKICWDFNPQDFKRIWTFCSLLLLTAAVYAFTASEGPAELHGFLTDPGYLTHGHAGVASARTATAVIQWLPIIFFLFIAAQALSRQGGVPLETISLILRLRWRRASRLGLPLPRSKIVDVSHPYFALCLFAAGVHPGENDAFFWGLSVLLGWALWPKRSTRSSATLWATAFLLAVVLGFFSQRAIGNLNRYLGNLNPAWLAGFMGHGFDRAKSRTSLGQIGRAKGSGRIVLRVQAPEHRPTPSLLREASYGAYKGVAWYSGISDREFETVAFEPNGTNQTSWVLVPDRTNATARITLSCYLPGNQALLPLPSGSARLENLPAFGLHKSPLGAVLAEGPGLVIFDALCGPGPTMDSPGANHDCSLSSCPRELPALDEVIQETKLRGQDLDHALQTIQGFFQGNFTYGFWSEADLQTRTNETPISCFLRRTRHGHCEFFATSTVLLLRRLGFPARYAVGYAVHEASGRGAWVVRQRDAHAWCLVWRQNSWQDFDTTPAAWIPAEASRASPLQFLSDACSRLWFEFSKFRWGQSHARQFILWGLAPVLLLLLYQILFRTRRKRQEDPPPPQHGAWPGLDSEFYPLERRIGQRGFDRQPGEPLSEWIRRATATPDLHDLRQALEELLAFHYRYRFDPRGLDPADRDALRRTARACLQRLDQTHRSAPPIK